MIYVIEMKCMIVAEIFGLLFCEAKPNLCIT